MAKKRESLVPKEKETVKEKTLVKTLEFCAFAWGGEPAAIDVNNGKIVRIRPLHYDWKYKPEELDFWKLETRGKILEPPMKSLPSYFALAYKKHVYSPNRIKYPLKRVDWDPNGERNPQNRGKSKYKRISWDKATDIIAGEIKRIHKKYGPFAILAQGDGHGETKTIHGPHGCQMLLLDKMGGYTLQARNPDSWEGFWWGAKHVWGNMRQGEMAPGDNVLKDVSENSDMVLFWGCDWETTPIGQGGESTSLISYWLTDVGVKSIYVCPDLNYAAAVHADKWIPVLPNTDAALQLAIAYIWITEGTYDKDYVATHTVGFDKFKDYVLGKEDGIAKTPAWASGKCGVPEWTIKALAREFASKTTSIAHHMGGGYIRGPYSHEPARLEACLLAMQGLGKSGVHSINWSADCDITGSSAFVDPIAVWTGHMWLQLTKQFIPKTLIHHAILNPPVSTWGTTHIEATTEDQFIKYTYPIPKEEGGTEIHMIWMDNPCRTTCWNGGNMTIDAYRSPKIECIVAQHPRLENDCLLADIILPANTKMEEDDIVVAHHAFMPSLLLEKQAIQPIVESKSDYEIVLEVAKKLGMYEAVTEGKTVQEWIKTGFDSTKVTDFMNWEEFKEKQYFLAKNPPDWQKRPVGMRAFYDDPENNLLETPSGKIEFYSERLAENFPDDTERPPIPKWIEIGPTHDERISSKRARKYPLLLMSNHGRWRHHSMCDDLNWLREIPTCKVKGSDGYMYEPLWINPQEAAKRGIKNGDIVKVYNERGTVLGGAYVTERLISGAVYMDHGARCDWIIPGELDRGGAINLISPEKGVSKNCWGQATSGYLVQVERVSMAQMEEWRRQHPEAFEREYDPASGLRFNAWVEGGLD